MTSSTTNADFSLRWEGDVAGSREVGTTVERNALVIFYPHYSGKKPVRSKGQCIKNVQNTPVFLHLFPFPWGSSTEEQKPEGVAVEEVNPNYGSCGKVLGPQGCPWYWEKTPANKQKTEARSCLWEKEGHGNRWPGSHAA